MLKPDKNDILFSFAVFAIIAILAYAMISIVNSSFSDRIKDNKLQATMKVFDDIIPEGYTNDIFNDVTSVIEPEYTGTGRAVSIYRARKGETPLGYIIFPVFAEGYNGEIQLGIGVRTDGSLTGVRVVSDVETEDLGGQIHQDESDWLQIFEDKSYDSVPREQWRVKSDDGYFDEISGATITSRSVINAVRNTLDLDELAGESFYKNDQ